MTPGAWPGELRLDGWRRIVCGGLLAKGAQFAFCFVFAQGRNN
jgi:hypothetical protein